MVQFRTFVDTFLFKEASIDSEKLAPIPQNTAYAGEPADGFVKTRIPTISQLEGFVKITTVSKQIKIPEPLIAEDFGNFCGLVTYAAREVGADRDYLMAVAYECTKNLDSTILGAKDSPKAGPFQFTAEAWQAAINGVAANAGFTVEHRLDWLRQPKMAALLAKDATESFKKEFSRLPVFKELYFLQLVGDAALAALKTPTDLCSESIIKILAEGRDAAEFKAGITVNAALTALQNRLQAAFVEALKVIDQQPAENRFMRASVGDPPWMAVAREQLARGIKEDPGDRNTEEIAAYFRDVNAAVGTVAGQTVPWCGAFVGSCIKNCGLPAAAAKVTPAAVGADFWLTWDQAPNPPPVGSIVVFPGRHVGFLAEGSTDTKLQILGGNQSDRVSIAPFDRAGAQFRWFGAASRLLAPAVPAGQGGFVTMAPKIMKKLLADFTELNEMHTAAILGNLGHECAGFTQLIELHPVHSGPPGMGWAQWTLTRGDDFRTALAGRPVDDFDGNYDFLRHELKDTFHKKAITAMKEKSDLYGAVVAFELIFEVAHPNYKHYESRMKYAQIALSEFQKTA